MFSNDALQLEANFLQCLVHGQGLKAAVRLPFLRPYDALRRVMEFVSITAFDTAVAAVHRVVLVADEVSNPAILQGDFHRAHGMTETANAILYGARHLFSPGSHMGS